MEELQRGSEHLRVCGAGDVRGGGNVGVWQSCIAIMPKQRTPLTS
jgi:hypothetical protein